MESETCPFAPGWLNEVLVDAVRAIKAWPAGVQEGVWKGTGRIPTPEKREDQDNGNARR